MSLLKNPYEISIWKDTWDGDKFIEKRVAIIGSNQMETQYRALSPSLKRNINGSNELTFKMHRRYVDNITGEKTTNPFVDLIANETKIKLNYKNKWFDFIVKSIAQDSNNTVYTYTATDLHINELSKNGYDIVLDTSLMNNSGTAEELCISLMKDTGWAVESDTLTQYKEERLVEMTRPDGNGNQITVYASYSSLTNKGEYFQYFTKLDKKIDGIYVDDDQQRISVTKYVTDANASKFGFFFPEDWTFEGILNERGNFLVYTHKSQYNPALNKIVYLYENDVAGYAKTDYISPVLIDNLVTNNGFKSSTGWTGTYASDDPNLANQGSTYNATLRAVAVNQATGSELIEDMKEGNYNGNNTYDPCLKVLFKDASSVLVNSGFYDNRRTIETISPKTKYVLFYKADHAGDFIVKVGEREYSVANGMYSETFTNNEVYLTFNSADAEEYKDASNNWYPGYEDYKYVIAEVPDTITTMNNNQYFNKKVQIFTSGNNYTDEYAFFDFQIFKFVPKEPGSSEPVLPENQAVEAKIVTEYLYYDINENPIDPSALGYKASEDQYIFLSRGDIPNTSYAKLETTEKIRSIDVKQSNRFNAIQSICETFECWADFVIEHDEDGRITSKTVYLREHINTPNYVGFRNGVNLKSTKRTLDSKAIVTKLIVPDNTNEFAKNGFCSIARANVNPSGENYIYNFQYYINQQLLSEEDFDNYLYKIEFNIPLNDKNTTTIYLGYYPSLLAINKKLNQLIEEYTAISTTLMKAESDWQVARNGKQAAEEKYTNANESLYKLAGYYFLNYHIPIPPNATQQQINEINAENERRREQLDKDNTYLGYFVEAAEFYASWQKFVTEEINTENIYNGYLEQSKLLYEEIQRLNTLKEGLNKEFFIKFYRFIQEGTWKSDEHTDDEKYYLDAYTTSDDSCLPKVTYDFGLIDISPIDGYEQFVFKLGQKTWVEDVEFFGYNADGTPYREEIVITETVNNLDEPNKDSIKAQNYKDEFASLFQKQTASIQSVQFAKGSWDKAANFVGAKASSQAYMLQSALQDASLVLKNAGDQSVVWDKQGIIVTDLTYPNKQVKIVGGAIMLRDQDANGVGWKTAITGDGINAKNITAGQINTDVVQIMNNLEPYFRWDAFGLTAFYYEQGQKYTGGFDVYKGVRFDRLGIYGVKDVTDSNGRKLDVSSWRPEDIEEVNDYATFSLTWDGLKVTGNNGVEARIGRLDGNIIKVTNGANNTFVVDNSGKVDITGKITAGEGEVGGWKIDGTTISSTKNSTITTTLYSEDQATSSYVGINQQYGARDWRIKIGTKFGVNKQGDFFAYSGRIGNWNITGDSLDNGSVYLYTVDQTNNPTAIGNSGPISTWRIKAGNNFGVTSDGNLYAQNANISGTITANEGNIGNWEITNEGELVNTNETVRLSANGKMLPSLLNGSSKLVFGNAAFSELKDTISINIYQEYVYIISGGKDIKYLQLGPETQSSLFGDVYISKQEVAGNDYKVYLKVNFQQYPGADTDTVRVHFVYSEKEMSFSLLEDGSFYLNAILLNKGTIGSWNINNTQIISKNKEIQLSSLDEGFSQVFKPTTVLIKNIILKATRNFFVTKEGELYAKNIHFYQADLGNWKFDYANNGVIYSENLDFSNSNYSTYKTQTTNLKPDGLNVILKTSGSGNTSYTSEWFFVAKAGSNAKNNTSDLRLKNSVQAFDDKYELLFDGLLPRRYKYNNGTSDRYHTGFIAQEVVSQLEQSGLTTQDFAAVCLEGLDEENGVWWLRRDEFVALNTWQIQKLKPRMSTAESDIIKLKQEVQELRNQLSQLKN